MLRADTPRASAMAGTAVFRMVVSNASMKKATHQPRQTGTSPESCGTKGPSHGSARECNGAGTVSRPRVERFGSLVASPPALPPARCRAG